MLSFYSRYITIVRYSLQLIVNCTEKHTSIHDQHIQHYNKSLKMSMHTVSFTNCYSGARNYSVVRDSLGKVNISRHEPVLANCFYINTYVDNAKIYHHENLSPRTISSQVFREKIVYSM